MNVTELIIRALAVYAVTMLLASSEIAKPIRRLFRRVAWACLPFRMVGKFVKFEHTDESTDTRPVLEDDEDLDLRIERKIAGYDYISCRMCTGVSVMLSFWAAQWFLCEPLAVYGLAQFIYTQERE